MTPLEHLISRSRELRKESFNGDAQEYVEFLDNTQELFEQIIAVAVDSLKRVTDQLEVMTTENMDCREDEDCDHCVSVQVIEDAKKDLLAINKIAQKAGE